VTEACPDAWAVLSAPLFLDMILSSTFSPHAKPYCALPRMFSGKSRIAASILAE
jgi:hypothetical protein